MESAHRGHARGDRRRLRGVQRGRHRLPRGGGAGEPQLADPGLQRRGPRRRARR